jgi:hypothetical protein
MPSGISNAPYNPAPTFPYMANFALCLLFLCGLSRSAGQETGNPDSLYIQTFSDRLVIRANMSTQTDRYIYENSTSGQKLDIEPNTSLRLFLSLDYKFIGASFGFAPGFIGDNNDEDLKGKSNFTDYRFRFFMGSWVQGVQYKNVKGFYVENTADYLPGWEKGSDPYLQIPSLKSITYGMSTSYVFNPDFSLKNIFSQSEWQKRSAGSFVPTLYYDYTRFSFTEDLVDDKEHQFGIRLAAAYYYTFVYRQHWHVSANLSPSLGIRHAQERKTEAGVFSKDGLTYTTRILEGGIQLGYNTNRVFFGANMVFNANWYNESRDSTTENDQFYGLVYVGYRFDPPGLISKPIDKLEGKSRR